MFHRVSVSTTQTTHSTTHLHAVESLSRVAQPVASPLPQHVLLCQVPQLEHVAADLPPQHEALQHVVVLPTAAAAAAAAAAAGNAGERWQV
jgi:hypothetical protein